ncbi:MAG: substrate-binding domain-containing protein [Eubacteriales bacterium]|nr:substrate-binding domain-containing protein [Eubacteriales bacterium]
MKHAKLLPFAFLFAVIGCFLCIRFNASVGAHSDRLLKRYAVIVPTDTIGQNLQLSEGLSAASEELHVYIRFLEVSSFEEQKAEVDKALLSGFDGILLCPMDNGPEGLDMLDTIRRQGVGLVTLLNRISDDVPCIASAQSVGRQAALEFLSVASDPENIYILIGDQQNIVYQNRASAFSDCLAQNGISVSGTLALNIDIVSSTDQVEDYILENQIRYLFCTDAASTASAVRYLDSSLFTSPGIIGCDDPYVSGEYFDATLPDALIRTDYYEIGYEGALLLDRLTQNEEDSL